MDYREINLENWGRRKLFDSFNAYENPCMCVNIRLDVTNLLRLRQKTDGFSIPFMYLLTRALSSVQGARLRLLQERVVDCTSPAASFTLKTGDHSFCFCRAEYYEQYEVFEKSARAAMQRTLEAYEQGTAPQKNEDDEVDVYYYSSLPWIDTLSISNPLPYHDRQSLSIPRLNWSKYVKEGERYKMTLSLTFSHALIDGFQLSQVVQTLEAYLEAPEQVLFP